MERSDLLTDIPSEVIQATLTVGNWMARNGWANWMLGPVADRTLVERYEKLLAASGVTHWLHCSPTTEDGVYDIFDNQDSEYSFHRAVAKAGVETCVPLCILGNARPVWVRFLGHSGAMSPRCGPFTLVPIQG